MTHKLSGLAAQVTPIPCPCCGTPLKTLTVEIVIDRYDVSEFQARILAAIWKGRGLPVSAERLFDAMYGDDPNGGPEPPKMYAALKEALHRLRAKLDGSGIGIASAGYRRGYRLVMGKGERNAS